MVAAMTPPAVLLTLATTLVCVPLPVRAQDPALPDRTIIAALDDGTLQARSDAVTEVLRRAGTPSPELISALARELSRMNVVVSERGPLRPAAPRLRTEWYTAAIGDYYGDLIQANASVEGDEPTLLALIGALQTGRMASTAVAAYGQRAFPVVLDLLSDETADPAQRAGAGRAIERMLLDKRVDGVGRQRVVAATHLLLSRIEDFQVVSAAIDVAATTGDAALTALVRKIADNPAAVRLSQDDARVRQMVQRRARASLAKRP